MTKPFAVIDCETDPFKAGRFPAPFLWGVYSDVEGFVAFEETRALVEYCEARPWVFYAHNGGRFDFHFLTDWLDEFQELLVINGRLSKFEIGLAEFRDSWLILPVPLGSYDKLPIDYALFEEGVREHHMPEIVAYLRNDCEKTYELIAGFRDEFGSHLTLAGACIKRLAKMEGLKLPRSSAGYYGDLGRYYYGGRVEVFRGGIVEGPIRVFDINSAYPWAMLDEHPYGGEMITTCQPRPTVVPQGFYTVDAVVTGAFPYRADDGGLEFPADRVRRRYHVTGWELLAAERLGLIRGLRHVEQRVPVRTTNFRGYIEHYYRKKAGSEKGSVPYILAKLAMNAAYGKFAANPSGYSEFQTAPPDSRNALREAEGWLPYGISLGDLDVLSRPLPEGRRRYYDVATGASITGRVRAYMLEALHSVDAPLYCDTDAIVFRGEHSLPLGPELGQWDDEGTYGRAAFAGKKLYALVDGPGGKEKVACKGVRLTAPEIFRVADGETVKYSPEVPTYSLSRGVSFVERKIRRTA